MTGLLGMATKYAEALLSVRFRVVDEHGEMSGGPMYFLSRGISARWLGRALGAAFALFAAIAAFGIGNGVQSQEVANTLRTTAGVEPLVTTSVLAVLVAAVILGGIRSIARFVGVLVPAMLVLYMGGALAVLFLNLEHIPRAFAQVDHLRIQRKRAGWRSARRLRRRRDPVRLRPRHLLQRERIGLCRHRGRRRRDA